MDYRKHLEEKFRKYQSILADRAEEGNEEKIDLESISRDFCEIDDWGRISVRHIPTKGDDVYFTICQKGDGRKEDVIVPISRINDEPLNQLVEIMRKAMIIEELRNTYTIS